MAGKRAARPAGKNRALRAGIAAAVALLLVVLVVWGAFTVFGGDDDTTATPSGQDTSAEASTDTSADPSTDTRTGTSASSSPTSGPSASASQEPAALRACAREITAAQKVVSAAKPGVAHWHQHVQARTDMLEGRMSVSKMDAMWKATRLAGPADQRRFRGAMDSYHPSPACTHLGSVPAADKKAAADCRVRYRRAQTAVDAAKAAMADWRSHLNDMAAFAAGKVSTQQAQDNWVEAWSSAPPHIKAYEKARTALNDAPSCPA